MMGDVLGARRWMGRGVGASRVLEVLGAMAFWIRGGVMARGVIMGEGYLFEALDFLRVRSEFRCS
jgi:hypothetical protein